MPHLANVPGFSFQDTTAEGKTRARERVSRANSVNGNIGVLPIPLEGQRPGRSERPCPPLRASISPRRSSNKGARARSKTRAAR